MTKISLFHRLISWITPYRAMLASAIICLLTIALTTALLPLLIKQLLDSIVTSNNKLEGFKFVLLTIAGLLTLRGIAGLAGSYILNRISGKIGIDLRTAVFEKLLALPVLYPEKQNPDKLAAFFVSNIDQASKGIVQLLTILWKELFTVLGLLLVMLWLNWEFSLMGMLIALVIGTIMQFISQASNLDRQAPLALIDSLLLSRTSLAHIKSVKLEAAQLQESQHFRDSIERQRSLTLKRTVIKAFGNIIALIMTTALLSGFFLLSMQQLSLDKMTVGDAGALLAAMLLLVFPLKRLLRTNACWQNKFQVINDIDSLLVQQNEMDSGSVTLARARGRLQFEAVSMHQPSQNHPPLLNLTFTLQPGEIVGLANSNDGHEGSLIDLTARFVSPADGRILLDGIDIATLKLANLRVNIAWVTPNTELLNDTIAANIAYGTTRCATEASIMQAARACHVTRFAREMPHGLQTKIDNKAIVVLTENQRQCILIARAFLKNPTIVIIDETTSQFDTECASVNEALDTLIRNRTTLIISSQPTMLEKAHRILKLT